MQTNTSDPHIQVKTEKNMIPCYIIVIINIDVVGSSTSEKSCNHLVLQTQIFSTASILSSI